MLDSHFILESVHRRISPYLEQSRIESGRKDYAMDAGRALGVAQMTQ